MLARKISEHTGAKIIAFDILWVDEDKKQPVPEGVEGWKYIRKVGQSEVEKALRENYSVVYDDNNPKFEHREELREVAKNSNAESVVIYLNTPIEVIKSREYANRETGARHDVSPANFQKVLEQFEPPSREENVLEFNPDTELKEFLRLLNQ